MLGSSLGGSAGTSWVLSAVSLSLSFSLAPLVTPGALGCHSRSSPKYSDLALGCRNARRRGFSGADGAERLERKPKSRQGVNTMPRWSGLVWSSLVLKFSAYVAYGPQDVSSAKGALTGASSCCDLAKSHTALHVWNLTRAWSAKYFESAFMQLFRSRADPRKRLPASTLRRHGTQPKTLSQHLPQIPRKCSTKSET